MKYLMFLFFTVFAFTVQAQENNFCGTENPDSLTATQLPYFGNNEILYDVLNRNNYKYDGSQIRVNTTNDGYTTAQWRVPIKIWITQRSDGSDGMAVDEALAMIEQINEVYEAAGTGIQFYRTCDIDFIADDGYHDFPNSTSVWISFLNTYRTPEVINLYFANSISGFEALARRPDQTPNLATLVTRTATPEVFAHEIGHVLGLLHTHNPGIVAGGTNGQVGQCYQESVDRQRDQGFFCHSTGDLKCEVNGDFLCDTEADPLLGTSNVTSCAYSGGDTDKWNDAWIPDCSNLMSYAPDACRNSFTPMQLAIMIIEIQNRIPHSYQLPANDFDVYEPDDLELNAKEILMSTPQYHTFHWSVDGTGGHEACDVDWLNYSTVGTSGNFTIRTYEQGFWPPPNTRLTGFSGQVNNDANPFTGFSFLRLLGVPTGQDGHTILIENTSAFPHPHSNGHYGIEIVDCNDCCSNGDFYKVPTLNSTTGSYNLPALSSQSTEAISENLNVAGVDLTFNKNVPLFYVNFSTALPAPNSLLEAKVCNNASVEIRNNSRIEVGAPSTNRTANLRIKSGSSLILKSGSTLIVNNDSRLIVESGAKLIVEPGVDIQLNGNNAILEIDGLLKLANNTIFTYSGSGHIILGMPTSGPKISCGTNSEIHLQGANSTDLILEIKNKASLRPEATLRNLVIEDGTILMGTNSFITTANADFKLEDLDILGSTPNTVHKGIFVNGQSNHILNRIDIQDGNRGITAYQYWNQGALLQASNLDISNCDIGLLVYGKGTFLNACNFEGNRIGYQHELSTFNSKVIASDFSQNEEYGVYFNNASGDLRAKNCEFDQNGLDGIRFSGNASFAPSCGSAKDNGLNGIYLGLYSRLFMDNSYESQGAGMNVVRNPTSIKAALAADIYLNDGKNDIKSLPFNGGHRDINGTLLIFNSSPLFRLGTENHWNDRNIPCLGKPPAYGTDYQLTGITNNPIYYSDAVRFCPPAMCSSGPGDDGGESGMNRKMSKTNSIISTTNFPRVALSQAIEIATDEMEVFDEDKNDLTALTLFYEILTYEYSELSDEDSRYLNLAYARMLTTFHHACTTGKIFTNPKSGESISDDYLDMVIESSKSMEILSGEPIEISQFLIDQALTFHTLGNHIAALEILSKIKPSKLSSGQNIQQKFAIDYYTCMISAQDDVLSGRIELEEFEESILYCQMDKNDNMKVINRNENESIINASEINVYPNPTKAFLSVEIPANLDGHMELEIFDIQGRQMIRSQHTISMEASTRQVNISDLSDGIYFLKLKIGEQYFFHKVIKQQ